MAPAASLRFDGRVAVITGAGGSLGRSHARVFAARGARVLVNDLAPPAGGQDVAQDLVDEIVAAGGTAVACHEGVEHGARIVEAALAHFGRIDIVVNNAGVLRDCAFHNMSDEHWDEVLAVHLHGAWQVTRAAWPHLRAAGYGRIVMTTSTVGLHGNFGQANYASAKLALHGLCQSLAIEGRSRNIHCNSVAPVATSAMTQALMTDAQRAALGAGQVSPLVAWLCHEDCQATGALYEAGAGWMARLAWVRGEGEVLRGDECTPENVAARWEAIDSLAHARLVASVADTTQHIDRLIAAAGQIPN